MPRLVAFSAAFAEATRQLGEASPAVRIAGVYALAAIADQCRDRRQQCIDVLCGHIRLPYDPFAGAGRVIERTLESGDGQLKVRASRSARTALMTARSGSPIIRTIRDHLRADAAVSWQGHDFDFAGATFDGGDLSGAAFLEVKLSSGRTEKYCVELPNTVDMTSSILLETTEGVEDASELLERYLRTMESLIDDAEREFLFAA